MALWPLQDMGSNQQPTPVSVLLHLKQRIFKKASGYLPQQAGVNGRHKILKIHLDFSSMSCIHDDGGSLSEKGEKNVCLKLQLFSLNTL